MSLEALMTELSKTSEAAEIARKREAARQAAEPFKTMVEPKPAALAQLRGWKPPAKAYVLFETNEYQLTKDGAGYWTNGLMTLDVEGRPEQFSKIETYTAPPKKFRILHYGNFPKMDDKNPARARLARLYGGKDGKNPWDAMEQKIRYHMGLSNTWDNDRAAMAAELQASKDERKTLEDKIAAAERENAELKKKLGSGKPGQGNA